MKYVNQNEAISSLWLPRNNMSCCFHLFVFVFSLFCFLYLLLIYIFHCIIVCSVWRILNYKCVTFTEYLFMICLRDSHVYICVVAVLNRNKMQKCQVSSTYLQIFSPSMNLRANNTFAFIKNLELNLLQNVAVSKTIFFFAKNPGNLSLIKKGFLHRVNQILHCQKCSCKT